MALTKHGFIDEYPYLVYTDVQTAVYSDKADTSIDDILPSGTIEITENGEGIDVAQYAYADVNVSGGGGEWGTPVQITYNTQNDVTINGIMTVISQELFDSTPPNTYMSFKMESTDQDLVPSGLYCAMSPIGEFDTVEFISDGQPFTDYEINQHGMYVFQIPNATNLNMTLS